MSKKTLDGLNYIVEAINNIVEPKVISLKYDKTYRAKVTEIINDNLYKVQINGAEYNLSYEGNLDLGQIVKVKAPLNNFSDIYIEAVPGSSSGGGTGGTSNYNDLTNKPILNTNNSNSLSTNASETIRGTISLHKISKTGNYEDLNNQPSLNFISLSQKGVAGGVASLDTNGVVIKTQLPGDIVYDADYVHTDNNFTNALLTKLNGINSGAEVNTIDVVQQNGNPLTINNKTVNVIVPTRTSDLTNNGDGNLPFITSIPMASSTSIGGIKVGANLSISSDGTLSAIGGGSGDITVIDNLNSTSSTDALSANQGRILNNSIQNNKNDIETLQNNMDNKLEVNNIIAGQNISITKSNNNCTINATVPTKTSDLTNDGASGISQYVEQSDLGTAATRNVGTASGNIPVLDNSGKLSESVLPSLAITEVFVINSQSEMLALDAQVGDIAVRTDISKNYILQSEPASILGNWVELLSPADNVLSVNNKTGNVVLTSDDINVGSTSQSITDSLNSLHSDISDLSSNISSITYSTLSNKPILNTNNSSALSVNSSETINGTISLHKISKTGSYDDLLNRPSLDFIPTSQKGAASGVASLDNNTKIPIAQLPIATTSSVGAIRVGANLSINGSGVLSATDTTDYDKFTNKPILNTNNTSELTINSNEIIEGTINLHAIAKTGNYTDLINKPSLDFIPSNQKGEANGVATLGSNSKIPNSQVPIASSVSLGGIKVGNNLSIDSDGTLNAIGGGSIDLLSTVYPLGSIYMSLNNVSPETFVGGHWKYIAQGRTLMGVDTTQSDFNDAGKIGGGLIDEDLRISSNEWGVPNVSVGGLGYTGQLLLSLNKNLSSASKKPSEMGYSFNPPYITCYIWVRYLTSNDAQELLLSQQYNNSPNYVASTENTSEFYYTIRVTNNQTTQNFYWNVYMYSGEIVNA